MSTALERLSAQELEAEAGAVLPTKEVMSVPLLDLNADTNLALDGINLNSDFYAAGTNVAIANNTVSGFLYGVHIRNGGAGINDPS